MKLYKVNPFEFKQPTRMLEPRSFCNTFNLIKPPIKVEIGKDSEEQLVSIHSSKPLCQIQKQVPHGSVEPPKILKKYKKESVWQGKKPGFSCQQKGQEIICSQTPFTEPVGPVSRRMRYCTCYLILSVFQQMYEHRLS